MLHLRRPKCQVLKVCFFVKIYPNRRFNATKKKAKIVTLSLLRCKVMNIGHFQKKTHTLKYPIRTLKSVCSSWFALISRDRYEHTHLRVPICETVRLLSVKNNSRPVCSFFLPTYYLNNSLGPGENIFLFAP